MMRAHFRFGGATLQGRRRVNADAWASTVRRLVLADGAGQFGAWAAPEAVQAAMHTCPGDGLKVVEAAHRAVSAIEGAASTIVFAELLDGFGADDLQHVLVGNVGDSRCMLISTDGGFSWLTEMHNTAAELFRRGVLTAAEAETHPFRHRLTRSLGSADATPDLRQVSMGYGDRLLLVSDGAHEAIPQDVMNQLCRSQDVQVAAERIVAYAFERGATDNITAVLAEVSSPMGIPS